jgi:hypothetical protein
VLAHSRITLPVLGGIRGENRTMSNTAWVPRRFRASG